MTCARPSLKYCQYSPLPITILLKNIDKQNYFDTSPWHGMVSKATAFSKKVKLKPQVIQYHFFTHIALRHVFNHSYR